MKVPHSNLDFLAVLIGGSHLYGLSTKDSDIDYRGVYSSNNLSSIIGLCEDEVVGKVKEEGDDYTYFEVHRFFQLLRKTNTNSLEILLADKSEYLIFDERFQPIHSNSYSFIDSEQFLKSTRGYFIGESRLALGERTGKLGGKRKASLDRYGFSPKNVVQLLRITFAAEKFLSEGIYPIKLEKFDKNLHKLCLSIKTHPELWSKDQVAELISDASERLDKIEDKIHLNFDKELATQIIWDILKKKW